MSLLAKLYGWVTAFRNYLYDIGVFEVHDLRALTISVGNITAGGTGKTPLVAHIASLLADSGHLVCILTRGYGRKDESQRVVVSGRESVLADASDGGDEPVELAEKLIGKAVVVADADRVAAAEWAVRKFGITAFVLDDGFQHRKVRRDVDIVCIDATDPLGGGDMLPSGRLREASSGLRRADVLVITRSEQAEDTSALASQLAGLAPDAKLYVSRTQLTGFRTLDRSQLEPGPEGPIFAFCGIANPQSFERSLTSNGLTIAGSRHFADHHHYSPAEIIELQTAAKASGATALVTTGKDAVKLRGMEFSIPCYVAEIALEIEDPRSFRNLLDRHR